MLLVALLLPFVAQAGAMAADERIFHRRRGLPRWERIGHPLDTMTTAACYAWLVLAEPSRRHLIGYVVLSVGSCLFVTKDEPVHTQLCSSGEHFTHALLFVLHPIVLGVSGYLWWTERGVGALVASVQLVLTLLFAGYQILYWNRSSAGGGRRARVNNDVFHSLGERWYEADDDPVALLRAQARFHAPWIDERLRARVGDRPSRVLDVGCGGGLIANELARRGHEVTGVDIAEECLAVAARHDVTKRVEWIRADARSLPFADASFDAVCAMDFLEHVEPLDAYVAEFSRVLAPGGLFLFHTFNRTFSSWLFVIQGVALFIRNVPPQLHVLRLFVKPSELRASSEAHGLVIRELHGCRPHFLCPGFFRMVATGIVPRDLAFRFSRATFAGFTGVAVRRP
jgi:2-polyprenyl-6-hydroxyphenyl methylase/3-demethylubiquinone-9 3-methyltransferase